MKKYVCTILIISIALSLILAGMSLASTGTIRNSDFLNLRESPSTSANLLVRMPGNASFEILEEEGDWYRVQYEEYTGYVSKQYVNVSDEVVNSDIEPTINSNGIINKNSDVYVLPLLNSTKIGTLSSSDEVLVISLTGKWAYVQNDNISGWIFASNVNGVENNTDTTSNNAEEDNASVQTTSDENEATDNENANVESEEDSSESEDTSYPKTMYVNVDAVYIRESATTESEAVASVGLNTPVTVNGEEGDWYRVYVTDGTGYMMKQYLSEERQ